tara:strand:+ start:592 stop:1602 length:1011 start_codon:yes stop_codon:yes gene_type:complete
MNKQVAIVTGGAGFIGSHMVDLLVNEGFEVRIIDNLSAGHPANLEQHSKNSDVCLDELDIREVKPTSNLFKDADLVFHFAGIGDIVPSIEKPAEYMLVNAIGTMNVLEACRNRSIRKFVYAASSSCYGLADIPTTERHPIKCMHPYALSKFQGEQIAFKWHEIYKIPVNSVRIFNAYGLRSRTSGAYGAVFGVFLKQKLEKKPFTIVGDGSQERDFLYVTDVVKGFWAAANNDYVGNVWNLGAGKPQSVNKLVELLDGKKINIPKRPGEPDCTWADITKIKKELNWQPELTFEQGVEMVLENIEYWRNAPLWDVKSIQEATSTWFQTLGDNKGVTG